MNQEKETNQKKIEELKKIFFAAVKSFKKGDWNFAEEGFTIVSNQAAGQEDLGFLSRILGRSSLRAKADKYLLEEIPRQRVQEEEAKIKAVMKQEERMREKEQKQEETKQKDKRKELLPQEEEKRKKQVKRSFARHPVIGIDISDSSLEILHLNKERTAFIYGRSLIEKGVVDNGKIIKEERLQEILKETLRTTWPFPLWKSEKERSFLPFLKSGKGPQLKAILSLPQSRVFLQHLLLPTKIGIMENLKIAMSNIIPVPAADLYFTYQTFPLLDNTKTGVMAAAAPKSLVQEYINFLNSVNIKPIALDLESASIGRALLIPTVSQGSIKSEMIVDIGARTIVCSVFRNCRLAFSANIPFAGSHLTEKICQDLNVSEAEGEELKKQKGLTLEINMGWKEIIIDELRRIEKYYKREFHEQIDRIILAGGSSLLFGLREYFEKELARPVEIGDPLSNLPELKDEKVLREKESILFANVIGLALRVTLKDSAKKGLNFLPER